MTGPTEPAAATLPETLPLRSELVLHRRGETDQSVLEDQDRGKFFRLGHSEASFIESLIETSATASALDAAAKLDSTFNDDTAMRLCKWLVANELTQVDPTDTNADQSSQPKENPLATFFFWKVPICNPNQWLGSLVRYFGWIFSAKAMLIGLSFLLIGILQTTGKWTDFINSYENLFTSWRWMTFAIAWVVLKIIHETAHGATCRRYGGEVNQAGLAMILLMPIAFVNVTSSWRFDSRWKRLHVTLAGVAAELFVAGIALIAWNTLDSLPLQQAAADVFLLASVSSLLFNLNPLLKFDGYFALADATGVDNLYSYGQRYARYFGGRYILGLETEMPKLPTEHSGWIKVYGILASLYRVVSVSGLLIAAAALFQGAGIVIALAGIGSFIVKPLALLMRHLWQLRLDGEVSLARLVIRVVTLAMIAIGPLCLLPVNWTWTAPAVVQYDPPTVIRAQAAGFVETIHVRDGDTILAGQPVVTLRNDDLEFQFAGLQKELAQTEQEILAAQWHANSSELNDANVRKLGLKKRIEELRKQVNSLTLRSPSTGTVIARAMHLLLDTYVDAGEELAVVGREDSKRLMVSFTPSDAKHASETLNRLLRIVTNGRFAIEAQLTRIESRADAHPPDDSLLAINGGPLATAQTPDGKLELTEPRVTAYVALTPQQSQDLHAGQRAYVNIAAPSQTIGDLLYVRLSNLNWIP